MKQTHKVSLAYQTKAGKPCTPYPVCSCGFSGENIEFHIERMRLKIEKEANKLLIGLLREIEASPLVQKELGDTTLLYELRTYVDSLPE